MPMTETGFYYKSFSRLFAKHHHHYEHDIPFLSTFFYLPIFVFALINHSMFVCRSRQVFLKFYGQTNIVCTGSSVHNHMCVKTFSPGSCTVCINWRKNISAMELRPFNNYLPCPCALIQKSIITENTCDNI